jgi:hypothetical protein
MLEDAMTIEAMKQALEALLEINELSKGENAICLPAEIDGAMDALRTAIAEAEKQEPVAFIAPNGDLRKTTEAKDHWEWGAEFTPLYTTPPAAQRQWVGLTDEEIDEWTPEIHSVIQAIEAKLKEKNT